MYDIRLITGKLSRWGKFMKKYSLPSYDEIPDLGLYMDQVLTLMSQYLAPLTTSDPEDTAITAATINNYVRVRIMPAPEKKKYNRLHIAYLIIICTLKQVMCISDIQKIFPPNLTEAEVRTLYNEYVRYYKASILFFVNEVKDEADRILVDGTKLIKDNKWDKLDAEGRAEAQESFDGAVKSLIFSSATIANFSKLLTAKLVSLGDVPYTDEAVAERKY